MILCRIDWNCIEIIYMHKSLIYPYSFCSVVFGTQVHWRSPLPSYSSQCLCLCWEPADWKLIPAEGMLIANIYTITFFESSHANFPIQCRHCGHVSQSPWGAVFCFWSCCTADGVEAQSRGQQQVISTWWMNLIGRAMEEPLEFFDKYRSDLIALFFSHHHWSQWELDLMSWTCPLFDWANPFVADTHAMWHA